MSSGQADNSQSGASPERAQPEVTPKRWQRIKELVLAAEEVDPSNRDEFLRKACGSDEALRAEIESLLEDWAISDRGRCLYYLGDQFEF